MHLQVVLFERLVWVIAHRSLLESRVEGARLSSGITCCLMLTSLKHLCQCQRQELQWECKEKTKQRKKKKSQTI